LLENICLANLGNIELPIKINQIRRQITILRELHALFDDI